MILEPEQANKCGSLVSFSHRLAILFKHVLLFQSQRFFPSVRKKKNNQAMDSEQAKAGFSISNLLGFDRAQAEQPENSDNRHQLNLSENTGERESDF